MSTRRGWVGLGVGLVVGVGAWWGGEAAAVPPRPRPVWPVPNPTFEQRDFAPSTNDRQISGVFGPRLKWGSGRYDHHEGLDFYAEYDPNHPQGDHPVLSVLPGVVTEIIDPPNPERTETGRKVVVTHNVPWSAFDAPREWGAVKTGYLHLSRINVREGQEVDAGDVLGAAGETGYTSTVHLHFNCYREGRGRDVNVNPARIFSPERFRNSVVPVHERTVAIQWLERDYDADTVLARVFLNYNCFGFDGFAFEIDGNTQRAISFEHISAERRDVRDTGNEDLVPGLRLFPLRFNGGTTVDRCQPNRFPAGWPAARYPVQGGMGVRLCYDVLATQVPDDVRRIELHVLSVTERHLTARCRGFENVVGER